MNPVKLYLDIWIDGTWKVTDRFGNTYGESDNADGAVEQARKKSNVPIYSGPNVIDGEPIIKKDSAEGLGEDDYVFDTRELIEEMAELGRFTVTEIVNDEGFFEGYLLDETFAYTRRHFNVLRMKNRKLTEELNAVRAELEEIKGMDMFEFGNTYCSDDDLEDAGHAFARSLGVGTHDD